ncbi:hypothetical protein PIIN_10153 [Serendipita indica DSM 11827]|uniref:DUF6533 domain-containing protein n=1 Tax=Serendipita indica (strain DSM 11827) TaxID=1109443 RepID=G4TXW0_SERID|nr:hypothetical protein PIIN_10153 [Serendipita indica DSM 11827]
MVFRHNAFYYAVAALFTLLIYEYCITFHKEVQFIWRAKSKFTLTNCLFFLNRYLPIFRAGIFLFFSFFPPSNPRTCTRFTDINSWCTMLSVATVEILMLVRTWALYSKSRKVGIILLAVWLVALGGCVVVVKSSIKPIPGVIPLDPIYINPCDRPSPYKYFITYVIVLCFELFSFIIMMVRINSLASRTPSTNVRGRVRRSARPLIPTIQKHGLYYFTCVVCVMTLNVVASFSKSLSRVVINAGMGPIIASIACNRVIFALHGLYTEIDHGPRSAISSFKTAKPPSGNQNHLHVAG